MICFYISVSKFLTSIKKYIFWTFCNSLLVHFNNLWLLEKFGTCLIIYVRWKFNQSLKSFILYNAHIETRTILLIPNLTYHLTTYFVLYKYKFNIVFYNFKNFNLILILTVYIDIFENNKIWALRRLPTHTSSKLIIIYYFIVIFSSFIFLHSNFSSFIN